MVYASAKQPSPSPSLQGRGVHGVPLLCEQCACEEPFRRPSLRGRGVWASAGVCVAVSLCALIVGCPSDGDNSGTPGVYRNQTDPTNKGASYIGSAACKACHSDYAELSRLHAHGVALSKPAGVAPSYPTEATRAGVPNPPDSLTWNQVAYVIGGYLHGAFFVDENGYVLTDGTAGVNTQWNLDFGANGTDAGFAPYLPAQTTPLPYAYDCFKCHTTGPQAQSASNPRSQGGRPGIEGTWNESGVQCEACHGPGSKHVPNPPARNLFVDNTNGTCARCHTAGDDPNVIRGTGDGYLNPNTQYAELRASGGHAAFQCTVCHDPHASTTYDRARGIRNNCTACHNDISMAFHEGVTYRFGDYTEAMSCESCHMPLTGKSVSTASAAVVGVEPRIGDVRGHIFRIAAAAGSSSTMFNADGSEVIKDTNGLSAVTLDFVCLRCHHGAGNAFRLAPAGAVQIAPGIHTRDTAMSQ